MNDKFTITIKIADSSHPLIIDREHEEIYRKAAKLVNQRFADYKEKFKNVDLNDKHFLSFVALEYAVKYLKVDENKGIDSLGEKIEDITRELEQYLKNK